MDDLISRQLVIKTLCERRCGNKSKGCPSGFCTESLAVDCMPSAQPEIIRCKDCKNWYAFADKQFGYCRRECWEDDGQYRLKVETAHDDFCSYAERREE